MESTVKKSGKVKLLTFLIIAIIFAGIGAILTLADMDPGSGVMANLFVAFLGAIIAIQVIPGMMLFGLMFNGLANLFRRNEASKETE